jgi:hypothetical protein
VCSFRCEGDSPEAPEISPEIPDFPETPEKSPEYPGFTDKFVLSGDFQNSPIHPPSRRHQDPFRDQASTSQNFMKTSLNPLNSRKKKKRATIFCLHYAPDDVLHLALPKYSLRSNIVVVNLLAEVYGQQQTQRGLLQHLFVGTG